MDRHEAAEFAESVDPDLVLPVHYDTFDAIETDAGRSSRTWRPGASTPNCSDGATAAAGGSPPGSSRSSVRTSKHLIRPPRSVDTYAPQSPPCQRHGWRNRSAAAGCTGLLGDEVVRNDSHAFEASGDSPLDVRNRNGDVAVGSHDGEQVEVDVELRGPSDDAVEGVSVTGEQRSDAFVVAAQGDGTAEWWTSVSVDLSIRVPAAMAVERVRTRNGDVEVTDVAGGARSAPRTAR